MRTGREEDDQPITVYHLDRTVTRLDVECEPRVPLDDHMLNIYVEDAVNDVGRLRYVADSASNVSSRVKIPGYNITGFSNVVKPHTYKTTYGDPRMAEGKHTTFRQERTAAMTLRSGSRPGWPRIATP